MPQNDNKTNDSQSRQAPVAARSQMLVNYIPGEECRVAVVRDGQLEELHAERMDAASHVGNIYVGRVANVESGIQAAFIDFGLEENGFLHISDLHPRYFPDAEDDETEKVGKKTPRRERPPIQRCLKRGQEVIVQVLKEGIGTKGPTLTSYLSIPGRYLVMMPHMDKVGVSRRVEDEDTRREMRQVLDQLDLPEGFGFILRTAGLGRTKTDLKRDLAYLQRLWKDMQARLRKGNKPRLLYAESDLLVRCLRDVLTSDIEELIIDDEAALKRASRFLKIVAPRSGARVLHYDRPAPIFHAFGVEDQIDMMAQREVPLPSGGSIVIDETEALVAIDVNSGRMRNNSDAETTAYKTNCEAVDVICRQLKLRELGGVVIMDLIDMRAHKHRKAIETQVKENLKRDRANTKIVPISEFGIMQMTRQRMRGSHRKTHFTACPACEGRGMVQRPASVTAEALREVAALLAYEQVHKAEVVVSPRIAGELLSIGRARLSRMERMSGKRVTVRVSGSIAVDELQYFAYDHSGADIEIDRLPRPRPPKDLPLWEAPTPAGADWALDPAEEAVALEKAETEAERRAMEELSASELADEPIPGIDLSEEAQAGEGGRKRRRRRRRGGRGRSGGDDAPAQQDEAAPSQQDDRAAPSEQREEGEQREGRAEQDGELGEDGQPRKKRRRRRRRGGRGRSAGQDQRQDSDHDDQREHEDESVAQQPAPVEQSDEQGSDQGGGEEGQPRKKRRRRRRRRRSGEPAETQSTIDAGGETDDQPDDRGWPDGTAATVSPDAEIDAEAEEDADSDTEPTADLAPAPAPRKKGRSRRKAPAAKSEESESHAEDESAPADDLAPKKKTRSRSKKKTASKTAEAKTTEAPAEGADQQPATKKKTRSRKKAPAKAADSKPQPKAEPKASSVAEPKPAPQGAKQPADKKPPAKTPPRSLYGAFRRTKPSEVASRAQDDR